MFENFPISIETNLMEEDQLLQKIKSIKDLHSKGFTWDFFKELLINAHNGQKGRERNSFDLEGWVDHYGSQFRPIEVEVHQMEAFVKYLIEFNLDVFRNHNNDFTLINSPDSYNFQLEYIVFMTLEVESEK